MDVRIFHRIMDGRVVDMKIYGCKNLYELWM